jgi:hypothetical protein
MLTSHEQNADQYWDIKIGNTSLQNVTLEGSGNNSNKSKLGSGGNEEEIEFW